MITKWNLLGHLVPIQFCCLLSLHVPTIVEPCCCYTISRKKCKMEMFMYLCMLDHAGNDNVDPFLNVVDVCRQISQVDQMPMVDGKLHTAIPDKLFDKFSEISVSLLDNASSRLFNYVLFFINADIRFVRGSNI